MGRGSRHKSHRSRNYRDWSDSEEEADSGEGRPAVEAAAEDPRASRVWEPEKRISLLANGDLSGENGKKRKDRREDSVIADRWNGGGEEARVDTEKSSKLKLTSVDLKCKSSSRRRESSSEQNEEKSRYKKESTQRESASSGQHKDGEEKERERERERESENNKKDQSRKERAVLISELQDEMRNPELEKELEKRMKRRRDGSGDNNNLRGDGKETDARRTSSKDDHLKNGSYKDDRYKEGRNREKYRHYLDKDQQQRDDKRRDEHSSGIQTSDRSDNKYSIDENRLSESRYKTKLQDSDHDGSPYVDCETELEDNRGRKRSSGETEDSSNVKRRNTKESWDNSQRNGSRNGKSDSHTNTAREQPHPDNVDSGLSNSHPKWSPGSTAYAVKDQTRHNSRQAELSHSDLLSEETHRLRTTSRGDHHARSDGRERVSVSRSMEKTRLKDDIHSDVLLSEASAASHLRSDTHSSPNHLTSDQRSEQFGARRILDVEEVGQRSGNYIDERSSSSSKDVGKDWDLPIDKLKRSGSSQLNLLDSDPTSLGPSSYNRTTSLQDTPPGHLPPAPPVGLGVDSPSVLGSYEDENRNHNADLKTNHPFERNGGVSVGRGSGTPWKSTPTWSPAANGFMPLQHGSPGGFHPAAQFPASPLFGVKPSMGSYHPHEANRFSGHTRPYGWHNSVDDCPPHLPLWDGNNNMFNDESLMYGRPDWDQKRHLMGNRGWQLSVGMWCGQNGNANMEFPDRRKVQEYSTQTLADETWAGKSGHCSHDERVVTETDDGGINKPMDASLVMNVTETPQKVLHKNESEPSNIPSVQKTSEMQSDNYVTFYCNYLSKLGILSDLVQSEFYEKNVSLVGAGDGVIATNVTIWGHQKNNKLQDDARAVAKSKNYFLNSRSPISIDAVFQRAVSLYKKQKEAAKESVNPGLRLASSEEERVASAPDVATVNADSPKNGEDDLPMAGAIAEEKQCSNVSESAVLAEGSEVCQALMPECSVNLSRIHLSLKSTR